MKPTAVICVAILVVQFGCTHAPVPGLSDEARTQLGAVGVFVEESQPESDVSVPAKGWFFGAGRKSARWAAGGFTGPFRTGGGGGDSSGLAGLLILSIAVVAGTVGGLSGAVVGAVQAEPSAKVGEAEQVISQALARLNIHERLCTSIADQARNTYGENIVLSSNKDALTATADTILEISQLEVGLTGDWDLNPPLTFKLSLFITLKRSRDGQKLFEGRYEYIGQSQLFYLWADNSAADIFAELDKATTYIGDRICADIFLKSG